MKAQDKEFSFTLPNIRSIILGHEHNSTFKKNTFVEISIEILKIKLDRGISVSS